jgi:hypothetical protein
MQNESAWLIERVAPKEFEGPRYLMGVRHGYGCMWTTDHEHAIRFARMVDATRLIETLNESARAVEHMWHAPRQDIMDGRNRRDMFRNPRSI